MPVPVSIVKSKMRIIIGLLSISLLLTQLMHFCSSQSVYLSLGSTTITTNNTEVLITDIGEDGVGRLPSLTCHTDLTECCRNIETGMGGMGEWYYPDGRVIPNQAAGEGFYRVRNAPQVVRLARREASTIPALSPTGTYCCVIPTTGGEMTFCANLVVCPSLSLTNGMISYSDPTLGVGSVVTYSCDTGYTLNGVMTRTCQSGGTWSGSAPTCEVNCQTLTNPMNGMVTLTTTTFGGTATYSCNTGYTLNGDMTRTCESGGTWSGSAPTCGASSTTPVTVTTATTTQAPFCSDLDLPSNTMISYSGGSTDNRPVGTVATYSCNTGYTLNGGSTRTCESDGTWTGSEPTCIMVITCTDLMPLPSNVREISYTSGGSPDNRPVGTMATYSCNTGYTLNGDMTRTCQSDRTWSGSDPTCVALCPLLTVPNGNVTYSMSGDPPPVGTVATYSCVTGYERTGDETRTCEEGTGWTGSLPVCTIVDCGTLTDPPNGMVTLTNTTFESTATYSCDTGYTLSETETRMCGADESWTGSEPTCDASEVVSTGGYIVQRASLFQLRLTNINNCPQWVTEDQEARISAVTQVVVSEVESRCACGFTMAHVEDTSFQCFPGSDNAVTYRARIQRTPTYTPSQLIELIAQWIAEDGVARVQLVLISVDKSCQVGISSFSDSECTSVGSGPAGGGVDVAIIGGVVGGVVIALIFAITVVVIAILMFKSRRERLSVGKMAKRELPPVTLRGVVSSGRTEPYEMMELGHEYEDVSKFQQRGVVNPQQRGVVSPPEGGGEYEVIENTAVKHVSTAPTKSQDPPTQSTDTVPPPPSASQPSQPPPASQTEDKSSKDEFEFTECIAYETHTHAPPTATPTEGDPLYSN